MLTGWEKRARLANGHSRRDALKYGGLALLPFAISPATFTLPDQQLMAANGGTEPYPIPWLDKNGSHNQPAGLNLDPSHIYHFKGRVARCSTFTSMGTDNQGNRIAFGSPTTDYGAMQGEYWAARTTQQGVHPHMTDTISGTGGPGEPDSRFSPTHRAIRALLGRSCEEKWPYHQSGREYRHAAKWRTSRWLISRAGRLWTRLPRPRK